MKLLTLLALASFLLANVSGKLAYNKFKVTFRTKFNSKQVLTYSFQQRQGFTKRDKQAVLDLHNTLRNYLARGKQTEAYGGPMPPASNMLAMEWDDRLAEYAQNWANTCPSGHSPLNIPSVKISKAFLYENICGAYTAVERDMYGEVRDWNYRSQSCRPDSKCGHYTTLASWANFRMGCGWRVCSKGILQDLNMVCIFAPYSSAAIAVEGVRAAQLHEYKRGPPCSDCPQGWDFCLGGGLCATKKQCESKSSNLCKCLNDRTTCQSNGGVFDAVNCRCKCPATRYGTNCKHACANPPNVLSCGMDCGDSIHEIFNCYKSCGWCGQSTSRPYRHFIEHFPNVNSENIATTVGITTYDVPKRPNVNRLPSYGKCKNKESNQFCENIRLRHYCDDVVAGSKWKHFCSLSCNSCGSKAWINKVKAAFLKSTNSSSGGSFVPGKVTTTSTGWKTDGDSTSGNTGAGKTKGGWTNVGGSSGSKTGPITDSGWKNVGGSSSGSGGAGKTDIGWRNVGSGSSSTGSSSTNTGSSSTSGSGSSSSTDEWDNAGGSDTSGDSGYGDSYGGSDGGDYY